MRRLNLTGQRFGKLIVLRDTRLSDKKGQGLMLVQCDCGTKKVIPTYRLRNGTAQTCGCGQADHIVQVSPTLRGEDQPRHKLTNDDVISIRHTYATGDWTHAELANEYHVHPSCVGKVLLRYTWKHIS